MATPPVHRIDVRAFRYATEVPERVMAALAVAVPGLADPEGGPERTRTRSEGHFGHPIDVYRATTEDGDRIEEVFERLATSGALGQIVDELGDRVTDDCVLYVRLDKQRAFADERVELGEGIELRIKLEAYPAKPDRAIENLTAYLSDRGDLV